MTAPSSPSETLRDDKLLAELASHRLRQEIDSGGFSHPFILKERPGAKTQDKNYRYCPDCENWAWALPMVCGVKRARRYKEILNKLAAPVLEKK